MGDSTVLLTSLSICMKFNTNDTNDYETGVKFSKFKNSLVDDLKIYQTPNYLQIKAFLRKYVLPPITPF